METQKAEAGSSSTENETRARPMGRKRVISEKQPGREQFQRRIGGGYKGYTQGCRGAHNNQNGDIEITTRRNLAETYDTNDEKEKTDGAIVIIPVKSSRIGIKDIIIQIGLRRTIEKIRRKKRTHVGKQTISNWARKI